MTRIAIIAALTVGFALTAPLEAAAQVPFDVGISVKGGVNVTGLTKPGKKEFEGRPADITYPGLVGVSGQVGLFIEPRVLDLVGLEIGFLYSMAQAEGDINDQPITLKTGDLIIPVHARIATPGMVSFVAGLGIDFVVPLSSEAEKSALILNEIDAVERDITTYLGFGLGLEIDAIYVKVPIEFRGRYALGLDDTYDPRLELGPGSRFGFKTNWEWQGEFMVGVKYVVDVL